MWWIIGIASFAGLVLYCSCVAASNADDVEEKWWKEHNNNVGKGGDSNAN